MTLPDRSASKVWPCLMMFGLWLIGVVLSGLVLAVLYLIKLGVLH